MRAPARITKISNWYLFAATAVLAVTAAYGIMQFQLMMKMKGANTENEQQIATLEQAQRAEEEKYRITAQTYEARREEFYTKTRQILPDDEGYTGLTRLFDDFFLSLNSSPDDKAEQNNIVFGQGTALAEMEHISSLPVSMNIEANRKNLLKFLEFIEGSGTLGSGNRLMEIQSLTFNFPEGGELIKQPRQEVNFNVRMNAYYRTPKGAVQ